MTLQEEQEIEFFPLNVSVILQMQAREDPTPPFITVIIIEVLQGKEVGFGRFSLI